MENTIKIESLKGKNYKDVEGFVIRDTCPVTLKKSMVENVANMLVYKDEYGIIRYDHILMEILSIVSVASLYTNIELLDNDYENYDILNECGLADELYNYDDFYYWLELKLDELTEENDVNYVIAKMSDEIVLSLSNTLEHLGRMIDNGDPNKIAKYLSKGVEIIANKMPDFSELDVTKSLKENLEKEKVN